MTYRGVLCILALVFALGPAVAQEPADGELRAALRDYFAKRLRAELSLSDEQVSTILPRVQQLEAERTSSRMNKSAAVRELRRAYDSGAEDGRLQELLDRAESADRTLAEFERKTLAEIDAGLSVRQRVQLRFFIQNFRREMQERVRQLRREGSGAERRRPRGGR